MENRTVIPQPRLLRPLPANRLLRAALALMALAFVAALSYAGYYALQNHPSGQPPRGADAEARIAAALGQPETADATVRGNLLIERFFVVDVSSGKRYVLDVCKGRVRSILDSKRSDGIGSYRLLLERNGLAPERDRIAAFTQELSPPESNAAVEYLGLRIQGGSMESFSLNFDGSIPPERSGFRGPRGEDVYDYLWDQSYDDISFTGASLVNVRGTNFLLSNSELYDYFRSEFKINKAMFISQLIILDSTSSASMQTYRDIADRIPVKP